MKKLMKKTMILAALTGLFISCNNDSTEESTQGNVTVKLTDDPFPFDFATEANVTIAKIELKNENGSYVTIFEGNGNYNMVGLTNGITAQVNATSLEAGTYNEARITLNGASVQLTNGTGYNLDASANGINIVTIDPALVIEAGQDSEILFDLDINDSLQFTGMGGVQLPEWFSSIALIAGCEFNADFTAVDLGQTGTITGIVTDTNGDLVANALVEILVNGNIISTQTDTNGSFTFIGVQEGTYTVEVDTLTSSGDSSPLTVTASATVSCSITVQ